MDDLEDAYLMNRDPLVQRFIVGEGEPTLENVRHMIRNNVLGDYAKHGFGRLAVIHKADNRYIGFTGLKFVEELNEVDVDFDSTQSIGAGDWPPKRPRPPLITDFKNWG